MKLIQITGSELRFLKEVLNEIKEEGATSELDNAIELIDGLLTSSDKIEDLKTEDWLARNEAVIKSLEGEDA